MRDAGHYANDARLSARQRLWAESERESGVDLFSWVLDLANLDGDEWILDVGCGNRLYERALADRGHRGLTVPLDLSFGMRPDVCATAERLPFPSRAFDVVLAPHVLYHVPDVPTAALEARRVLRADGCFVAVTVSRRSNPQLRELVEDAVGGGWKWNSPPGFSFGLEDGELLAGAFSNVDLVRSPEGDVLVTDADLVADYVWSFGDVYERESGADWPSVVERVRIPPSA